jgi:SAM-dependent methyltransferase
MGIDEHLADGWVTTLELNAAFDRPWVDRAVEWVLAGAGAAVAGALAVDVGCGAGGAACAFARRAGTAGGPGAVLGLDRDPRLVAQARRRAAGEGVAGATRWGLGEVGRLPVRAGTAGLAWASGVVHHVPDQQAALGELAGLLVPGGTLALVEGGLPLRCLPHEIGLGRPGLEARLDEARARWFVDLRAELGGPPLPYGWPEALARAGLAGVRTRSFLAEATPPLDGVGRQVATLHLANARSELGDRLDADDRATLDRLLDPADEAWVGHREDLVVTAVRTVHAGTRPGP